MKTLLNNNSHFSCPRGSEPRFCKQQIVLRKMNTKRNKEKQFTRGHINISTSQVTLSSEKLSDMHFVIFLFSCSLNNYILMVLKANTSVFPQQPHLNILHFSIIAFHGFELF